MMKFSGEQLPPAEKAALKHTDVSSSGQTCNRFCENCGSPLEADDLFCSECGCKAEQEENAIKIEADEEAEEAQGQKPPVIPSDRMASILQTNRIKMGEAEDEFKNAPMLHDILENAAQKKNAKEDDKEAKSQKTAPALPDSRALVPMANCAALDMAKDESQNLFADMLANVAKKKNALAGKKSALLGHYVHKASDMTQYLVIESIQGNCVKASIKTIFDNGSYATEFYEGTLSGDSLHLQITDSDLHPFPDEMKVLSDAVYTVHHSIMLSENFDGTVGEDAIFGSFSGQFSKSVVFRKC